MAAAADSGVLIVLPRVDSTNTYAKNHFFELNDGSVVAAIEQTAGRGRLGRQWVTVPGSALTATAVLKKISEPFHAGAIVGLAGLELLQEYLPDHFIFFKWPNDIYIREYKIAGILCEGVLNKGKLSGVVAGIGINVNQNADEMNLLDNPATSMAALTGTKFFLEKMRFELAEKIKKYYIIYQSEPNYVLRAWQEENRLIGETLVLKTPDGKVKQGCFISIGEKGEMLLRSSEGEVFAFSCGDVKIDSSLINFKSLENKYYKPRR